MYKHVILDANVFIHGVDLSALRSLSEHHWSVDAALSEVRDARARAALSVLPFELSSRAPSDASVEAVRAFAAATGDLRALSRADLLLLALAHQLEAECNGAAFLRSTPPKAVTLADAPLSVREAAAAAAAAAAEATAAAAAAVVEGGAGKAAAGSEAGGGGGGGGAAAEGGAAPDGEAVGALAGWGGGEDDEGEWVGPASPDDDALLSVAGEVGEGSGAGGSAEGGGGGG